MKGFGVRKFEFEFMQKSGGGVFSVLECENIWSGVEDGLYWVMSGWESSHSKVFLFLICRVGNCFVLGLYDRVMVRSTILVGRGRNGFSGAFRDPC
jgi:hypothetical protein